MTDEPKLPETEDSELVEDSGSNDASGAVEAQEADAGSVESESPSDDAAQEADAAASESTGEVFLDDPEDEAEEASGDVEMDWYILKVAFNREDSIADALRKKIAMEGMEEFFGDVVVPSEDIATFTRDGKKRISKKQQHSHLLLATTWCLVH